ncbi:MAG: HAD family phosphatase [Candidatus Asgardarchaeum sp.]
MIKAIIFDCGGVLHTSNGKFISRDISKTFHISEIQFHRTCHKLIPLLSTGKISEKIFWKKFILDSGSNSKIPSKSPWEKEYLARFKKNKDVLNIAKKLKNNGYKIAVLSNTISAHAKINKNRGLYNCFHYLFLSYKIGLSKPDPKMYFFALNKLHTKAQEVLFIDDKIENIKAAKKIGFDTILFTNGKKLKTELNKKGII